MQLSGFSSVVTTLSNTFPVQAVLDALVLLACWLSLEVVVPYKNTTGWRSHRTWTHWMLANLLNNWEEGKGWCHVGLKVLFTRTEMWRLPLREAICDVFMIVICTTISNCKKSQKYQTRNYYNKASVIISFEKVKHSSWLLLHAFEKKLIQKTRILINHSRLWLSVHRYKNMMLQYSFQPPEAALKLVSGEEILHRFNECGLYLNLHIVFGGNLLWQI